MKFGGRPAAGSAIAGPRLAERSCTPGHNATRSGFQHGPAIDGVVNEVREAIDERTAHLVAGLYCDARCNYDAYCDDGTCRARPGPGEVCTTLESCALGLDCNDGICEGYEACFVP